MRIICIWVEVKGLWKGALFGQEWSIWQGGEFLLGGGMAADPSTLPY